MSTKAKPNGKRAPKPKTPKPTTPAEEDHEPTDTEVINFEDAARCSLTHDVGLARVVITLMLVAAAEQEEIERQRGEGGRGNEVDKSKSS